MGFVLWCLSYVHTMFLDYWVEDHLHRGLVQNLSPIRECCSQWNSASEVTFLLLPLFFKISSYLALSLMQGGTKPTGCLPAVFVSSMPVVKAAKWSRTSNFTQSPQRLLRLIALEKAFKYLRCWPWKPCRYLNGTRFLDWTAESLSCCKPIETWSAFFVDGSRLSDPGSLSHVFNP